MCTMGNIYVEDASSPGEAIRAVAQVYPAHSLKACVNGQWYSYDRKTGAVRRTSWRPRFIF
jgi:hypothetical protein